MHRHHPQTRRPLGRGLQSVGKGVAGDLSHGQTMDQRPRGTTDHAERHGRFAYGPRNEFPTQRIRPVQHDHVEARAQRRLGTEQQGADVGVEAHPHILQIDDQSIEVFEVFGFRRATRSVEADHRQATPWIHAIGDLLAGRSPPIEPMLRREQSDQVEATIPEHIDGVPTVDGLRWTVDHETNPQAEQLVHFARDDAIQPDAHGLVPSFDGLLRRAVRR